ncbi:GTPase activating protein [Balamuthia mandrillaris]
MEIGSLGLSWSWGFGKGKSVQGSGSHQSVKFDKATSDNVENGGASSQCTNTTNPHSTSPPATGRGETEFPSFGKLAVTVVKARGLPADKDSSYFCEVCFGEEKTRTDTCAGGTPGWDFEHVFDVTPQQQELRFRLFNTNEDCLGAVCFQVDGKHYPQTPQDGWHLLSDLSATKKKKKSKEKSNNKANKKEKEEKKGITATHYESSYGSNMTVTTNELRNVLLRKQKDIIQRSKQEAKNEDEEEEQVQQHAESADTGQLKREGEEEEEEKCKAQNEDQRGDMSSDVPVINNLSESGEFQTKSAKRMSLTKKLQATAFRSYPMPPSSSSGDRQQTDSLSVYLHLQLQYVSYDRLVRFVLRETTYGEIAYVQVLSKHVNLADDLARALVALFAAHGRLANLLKCVIHTEVISTEHEDTLFRSESLATKIMAEFITFKGRSYLKRTLEDLVKRICKSAEVIELNPTKLKTHVRNTAQGEAYLKNNISKLSSSCEAFLSAISNSLSFCPIEIRQVCSFLADTVQHRYPNSTLTSVGGFLFLRFFCPAILAPEHYELVKESPDPNARRHLTLVAKILQSLANGRAFGEKEEYMVQMNDFMERKFDAVKQLFRDFTEWEQVEQQPSKMLRTSSSESSRTELPPLTVVHLDTIVEYTSRYLACIQSNLPPDQQVLLFSLLPSGCVPRFSLLFAYFLMFYFLFCFFVSICSFYLLSLERMQLEFKQIAAEVDMRLAPLIEAKSKQATTTTNTSTMHS